jgi:hypothetical protein
MIDPRTFDDEPSPETCGRSAGLWRREVGRRMVAFVRAVGGLMTKYETTKHARSASEATEAGDACVRALIELERLSEALRQLRRSLHP